MKHIDYLEELDACNEAVEYASTFPTLQKAWDNCERGDWMLWILGRQSGEPGSKKRKKLIFTACQCARLALKHVKKGEDRPRIAIETVEAYCEGKATLQEVRAYAAYAAADAAYAAAYAAAAYAADAAAYAAYAYAAYAYAAADDAYAADAKRKVLKQCADIVRKQYPKIRMV